MKNPTSSHIHSPKDDARNKASHSNRHPQAAQTSQSFIKRSWPLTALCLGLMLTTMTPSSQLRAADEQKQEAPKGDNSGWSASVADSANEQELTEQQVTVLNQINDYLNNTTDLNGRFLQINPDDGEQKGKFFLKRPGRIRFDYSPPSLQRIIANGEYLSIEDRDIDTVDRFPLENTPFRILLAEKVDIHRDAIIRSIVETDEQVSVKMVDRKGSAIGEIELFFNKDPQFELAEWKVIDAQGQITRVILSYLDYEKKIDEKLFKFEEVKSFSLNP